MITFDGLYPFLYSLFLSERVGPVIVSEEFQLSLLVTGCRFDRFIFGDKVFLKWLNNRRHRKKDVKECKEQHDIVEWSQLYRVSLVASKSSKKITYS